MLMIRLTNRVILLFHVSQVMRSKAVIRSGYLYKKSLKQTGVRVGKAWQRRWFVLEVETNGGDEGTVVRTGKLTYFQSNKVRQLSAMLRCLPCVPIHHASLAWLKPGYEGRCRDTFA